MPGRQFSPETVNRDLDLVFPVFQNQEKFSPWYLLQQPELRFQFFLVPSLKYLYFYLLNRFPLN